MKNIFSRILLLFLSSRVFFLVAAILAPIFIPLRAGYLGTKLNPNDNFLIWVWANFDGQHYLDIAISGYQQLTLTHNNNEFAFFPLYPLVISALHHIIPLPELYLGLFISVTAFFFAIFFIYKITSLDYNRHITFLALFFLTFFPLSFFYHSVYTDSLFLLLTTACFYYARKGNWLLAGIFGGLATFDRFSGISLLPALLFEWYLQQKQLLFLNRKFITNKIKIVSAFSKQALVTLFLTLTGFLTYALYLQVNFGDWLLFRKAFVAWKQYEFIYPPQVLLRYFKIFTLVDPHLVEYWIAVLEFFSFIFYILLTVYVWKKVRTSYGIFMLVLLLLVTFTGTLNGGPRYMLHLFPGFIGIALVSDKNIHFRKILIPLFMAVGFILTALFTRGYFIS